MSTICLTSQRFNRVQFNPEKIGGSVLPTASTNIFTRYAKLKEQDGYNILFESDEDVYIFADELKMSQVIYNLVNNAVNYVGEDKTVIVTQKVNGKKGSH